MKIRPATLFDAVDVTRLWEKMNRESGLQEYNGSDAQVFLACWVNSMASGGSVTFVVDAGELVGFVYGHVQSKEYNAQERQAFCEAIYIDSKYRDGELYVMLLNKAIQQCGKAEVSELRFQTMYKDRAATRLWQQKGYEPMNIIWRKGV